MTFSIILTKVFIIISNKFSILFQKIDKLKNIFNDFNDAMWIYEICACVISMTVQRVKYARC